MTNKPSVFDWQYFDELTDGEVALQQEMLSVFTQHLRSDFQSLEAAFDKQDFVEWHGWIHKIYGACASMQAAHLADLCQQSKNAETEIQHHHQKIIQAYDDLKAELKASEADVKL